MLGLVCTYKLKPTNLKCWRFTTFVVFVVLPATCSLDKPHPGTHQMFRKALTGKYKHM